MAPIIDTTPFKMLQQQPGNATATLVGHYSTEAAAINAAHVQLRTCPTSRVTIAKAYCEVTLKESPIVVTRFPAHDDF